MGEVLAGYTIERVLGSGGMGGVYLARHPRMNRFVALKVLNDAFAADAKARIRFDREAALAIELDHPNIIPVYDRSGPEDPALWLAMRHIDGGDAASLLTGAGAGLPVEQTLRLITDAAHALDYAHSRGVLHRDVKPANLLIEHDLRVGERALLTDFGIARTLDDTATHSGVLASLAYTAPERFTDRPPTDHRADIYSLGCTLYQLLTGEPPFPRTGQAAVIAAHLNDPVPSASGRRRDLPTGLDEVIAVAMAKNPDGRYRTCGDLAAAAREAVAARTAARARRRVTSVPTATPEKAPAGATTSPIRPTASAPKPVVPKPGHGDRLMSRRRLLIGGAVAVPVTAAAVTGVIALVGSGDRPAGRGSAATSDDVLTGHTDQIRALAFSPDGTSLASGSLDRTVRLWDVRSRRPDGEPLDTGHAVQSLSFSPDGLLLATAGGARGDWATQLWDIHTRQLDGRLLDPGTATSIDATAFSPDGTLLAVARNAPGGLGAQLWNVRTQQLDGPQLDTGIAVSAMAFSPDGALVATGVGSGTGSTVKLWNVNSRRYLPTDLTGHVDKVVSIAFSPDGTLLATGSLDTTVRLWDVRTHLPAGVLIGHVGTVFSVGFTPDGTRVASGGMDKTVRLWDVNSHTRIGQPLQGHTDQISAVRFSPDGTLLASASYDRTVRLWNVSATH
ncbi:protein kinase [Nocardia sp. ET3-3]|uniref:Protein kinase n=1 Tax=Nocardia terrae TaxID=2675851 RepID=A0A7K1URM4_9NOCA|nr:serine/threonine-protein kinase [Nocardia terrae]MVU76809.1 protein kinase [Nocardia terrae]